MNLRTPALQLLALGLLVTAAPARALDDGFAVEQVLADLEVPVFFDFAPDGRLFFNEYTTGSVRVVSAAMELQPDPVVTFDDVEVFFERGFLGLELDPRFEENHHLYVYYSSTDGSHKLVRVTEADGVATELVTLRGDLPLEGEGNHNGGPIVFGPDQTLYLSIGEQGQSESAQDLQVELGKVLRMDRDGVAAAGNPFDGAVWALGLRNTFGLAFNPLDGQLYGSENGPTVDDEVNLLFAGANYGWPLYTGAPGEAGFEDALTTWNPNICPTGLAVYCGSNYPAEYLGDLFMGNCMRGGVRRLELSTDGERIVDQDDDWWSQPLDGLTEEQRYYGVLDVVNGPDGNLWFSTAEGIYRFVHEDAPAGPADLDCDLFDGEFPGNDDDSADVEYKKCTCTVGQRVDASGIAALVALALAGLRRRTGIKMTR